MKSYCQSGVLQPQRLDIVEGFSSPFRREGGGPSLVRVKKGNSSWFCLGATKHGANTEIPEEVVARLASYILFTSSLCLQPGQAKDDTVN